MRRLLVIQLLMIPLLFCFAAPSMVGQTQSTSPQKAVQTQLQSQGFLDYALGKINPSNADFGATMANGRDEFVGHTIDDLYFWSNVITLGLLVCAAGIVYFEWRSAAKKEIIAATIIAELWNGRISDRIEILRRTEQFNQLVELHNTEVEHALMAKQQPNQAAEPDTSDFKRTVQVLEQKAKTGSEDLAENSSDVPDIGLVAPLPVSNSAMSSQQQTLLLQRRLEATQNSERNLRVRLNQVNTQLDEERKRNRTLKGANG
jgi:hypothetical protein